MGRPGLKYVDSDPGASPETPVFVVFHGYGADMHDLAPIASEIALPRPLRWIFPDAPLSLNPGRMWFSIDIEGLERAQQTGEPWEISQRVPPELEDTRAQVFDFLASLGVPWSRLILGGFSQGAMLAVDLSLRSPEPPRGLVILSGSLIDENGWKALAPRRAGLPFFQSHGSADPILPYRGARALEALLKGAGLKGEMLRFENGHAITPEVIQGLTRFLGALL